MSTDTLESPASPSMAARLDKIYQRLARPDRPVDADLKKNPVVAAILSLLAPGMGQLYNVQLFKGLGFLILVIAAGLLTGLVSLLLWWLFDASLEGWRGGVGRVLGRVWIAFPVIFLGLWIISVVEAVWTATKLRTGQLIVRYGFRKQAALIAVGAVPLAGALIPDETCAIDDLERGLLDDVQGKVVRALIARKLRRAYMLLLLILGLLPIVLGAFFGWPVLVVAGALVMLWALVGLVT